MFNTTNHTCTQRIRLSVLLLLTLLLGACGGGGGGGGGSTPVSSLDLLDPTPGASNQFGASVIQLANGNIVVSEPNDSSVAAYSGAVHLYSPFSSTPIASIYGDVAYDRLGSTSITALGNNNYVIASAYDNEGGLAYAGSVRLVDGSTGLQIGTTLAGDVANDSLGSTSITALGNNNYVIASANDNEGGLAYAGSVRLVDGSTGVAIGAAIVGAVANDMYKVQVIAPVSGDYYILSQPYADDGGQVDAGRVRIVAP
jgi:hypothetical protein